MAEPTLIPYLAGADTPFHIALDPCGDDLPAGTAPRFPFAIVHDSGALTRIIKARVESDVGSPVREVFLLISRDDYPPGLGGMGALTNADVESAWQGAYEAHLRSGSLMALRAQDDGKGGILPFSSVFYCRKVNGFFHPPCPVCAQGLSLCRDDKALEDAGLQAYSTSLKRYLACPACSAAKGKKTYYSCILDPSDPPSVKGLQELILGYAGLTNGDLPCVGCKERGTCYQNGEVLSVIVPLAFYPFHLLMVEAASLNARDFLSLVSGATCPELEETLLAERQFGRRGLVKGFEGRAAKGLLFAGDERRFLEVLYLKLAFLDEVARYVLPGQGRSSCTRIGPRTDGLWVKVPDQGRLLGAFWTFKPTLMDMEPVLPEVPAPSGSGYAAWCMGMLWFHSLLGSRSLDARSINEGIARMLGGNPLEEDALMFGPDSIFREPAPVPRRWLGLWEKTLDVGRTLLQGFGARGDILREFTERLEAIIEETRKELFSPGAPERAMPVPQQGEEPHEAQIGAILTRIRSKWSQESPGPIPDVAPEPAAVILPQQPEALHEEADATLVMAPPQQQTEAPPVDDDFSTETIIMQHPPQPAAPKEPEAPDQTVVMGAVPPEAVPKDASARRESPAEEDLEATIIQGAPAKSAQKAPPERPAAGDSDELEETVIIKPDKSR